MDAQPLSVSEEILIFEDGKDHAVSSSHRRKEMNMMAHVRRISEVIGSRPSASSSEIAAARYVKREFQRLGLDPQEQNFISRRHAEPSLLFSYLLVIIAVVLLPRHPLIFFVVFLMGFLLCLLEYMGRRPLGFFQWRYKSKNIVLKISPFKSVDKKVVLLSHLDTPKVAFYHRGIPERIFGVFVLANFISLCLLFMEMITLIAAIILRVEKSIIDALWYIAILLTVPSFFPFLFILIKFIMRKYSIGANDDTSGLAILLNLAAHYSKRSLINTELWLVALGSEEAGSIGLKRFLRKYGDDLKGAFFIYIDAVGMGSPIYYRYEGMILPFRANKKLTKLAEKVKTLHAQLQASAVRRRYSLTSSYWLVSRGKRAITISSKGKSSGTHIIGTDDYQSLDPKGLRKAYEFTRYLVENIDRMDI